MKKNLRIVSAAAAALLAVAPVAASAVSVNAADTTATASATTTNKPTVDLSGAGSVSESKDTVNVTPSFTLTSAVVKPGTHTVVTPATLQGTVTASLNGTSVTADVADVAAHNVTLTSQSEYTTIYKYDAESKQTTNHLGDWNASANDVYVKAGNEYKMTLTGVGFSFGKANAGKTLTFKLPSNVTMTQNGREVTGNKVTLDQYGNVTGLTFVVNNIKALNAANTNGVSFYNTVSGLIETKGSYMTLANANGNLNVNDLLNDLKKQYKAVQLQNGELKTFEVTTTPAELTAELTKAGVKVNPAGDFEPDASFTVTLTAKSADNGKVNTLPVTVTVPNGKVVASVQKTIMHNAYYYDKDAKRVGTDKVTRYNTVTVATSTTKIGDKTYYEVVENGKATGKFINADNIDGTKRTLKHNAYVYKTSKKRANKVVLKKGETVTTYGGSYTFKNGKQYYKIGNNTDKTYVKASNF